MSVLEEYFRKVEEDYDHPLLRLVDDATKHPEMRVVVEILRKRGVLGFSPARLYLHVIGMADGLPVQPCQHDDWDDALNAALVKRGIRAISTDNEAVRFTLSLRAVLQAPENRFGDGYYNSVLVHHIAESPFASYAAVESILKHVYRTGIEPSFRSYAECRNMIDSAIRGRWEELVENLRYEIPEAEEILAAAVAQYLGRTVFRDKSEENGALVKSQLARSAWKIGTVPGPDPPKSGVTPPNRNRTPHIAGFPPSTPLARCHPHCSNLVTPSRRPADFLRPILPPHGVPPMPRACRLSWPFVLILMSIPRAGFPGVASGGDAEFEVLSIAAADADPLAPILAKPIIGPRQALADTLQLLEASIPRMPRPKSAAEWEQFAKTNRAAVFDRVIFRGPASGWRDAKTQVVWGETIDGGPGYRIKKLRYEALPGLWIPALLYEPTTIVGKIPVILNVNGHDAEGKAAGSEQIRCINLAKRGMYALHPEWFEMGQLRGDDFRHDLMDHINLCGASGVATHYLALTRGIDVLLGLEHADPERLAVTGLSGGGWQTIFVSAFDTRVKLCAPVAGYTGFLTRLKAVSDLGDAEQSPPDLGAVSEYTIMTALLAPRPALLIHNAKDECCFRADTALPPLLEAAGPIYQLLDKPHNLRSHVNHDPGTHNYQLDNRQAFYRMLGDFFFAGRADFNASEIPSDPELKPKTALDVAMPADNSSLQGLALSLGKSLPKEGALPADKGAAIAWRDIHRARIKEAAHVQTLDGQPEKIGEEMTPTARVVRWRIKAGSWAIPVVELIPAHPPAPGGKAMGTTLLIADDGRSSPAASAAAQELLTKGGRVLLMDPLLLGEAKLPERPERFALMISTIGERPLGIQAGQVAAIARLASAKPWGSGPISVLAIGPRAAVMALVASAVEEPAIGSVEVRGSLGSLKELIETRAPYKASPELFCFGLLEAADILQLAASCAPRPVRFVAPSERAKAELSGLKSWYKTWGVELD